MTGLIVIAALLLLIQLLDYLGKKNNIEERREYKTRFESNPYFRIQEKLRNCFILGLPKVWIEDNENEPEVIIKESTKGIIYYQGTTASDEFRDIIKAQELIGIKTVRCRECGNLLWINSSQRWNGFCSEECYEKCYSRDLRHQERGKNNEYHQIPLYEVAAKNNFKCKICDGKMSHYWIEGTDNFFYHTIDHIVPIIHGGVHSINNVQVVHFICNEIKGTKSMFCLDKSVNDIIKIEPRLRYEKESLLKEIKNHIGPCEPKVLFNFG